MDYLFYLIPVYTVLEDFVVVLMFIDVLMVKSKRFQSDLSRDPAVD